MKTIGLTGGIGSGKTTVSNVFRSLGAKVLDADEIYHDLIAAIGLKPSALAQEINQVFPGILKNDSSIDRHKLGSLVFANPEKRRQLEAISHPKVQQAFLERVGLLKNQGVEIVIYDVPLLFEAGLQDRFDGIIVVWVDENTQKLRLQQRDGLTAADVEKRLNAQLPLSTKKDQATWTIDNKGTLADTELQVQRIWQQLQN